MEPLKRIVLGTIDNYGVEEVRIFVNSLRQTGYCGPVVFFGQNVSPGTIAWLGQHGVQFRAARSCGKTARKFAKRALAVMRILPPALRLYCGKGIRASVLPCYVRRYFDYLQFLSGGNYERVLITDVRDVVFQRNPFESGDAGELLVYEEHPSQTVQGEIHNRNWIQDAYGAQSLDAIGNAKVICSGVTVGSGDAMARYLRAMCNELMVRNGRPGYDQGVHNYLVRTGSCEPLRVIGYGEGAVGHIGWTPAAEIELSDSQDVLNGHHLPYSVVHQYDRHSVLERLIKRRFGDFGSSAIECDQSDVNDPARSSVVWSQRVGLPSASQRRRA